MCAALAFAACSGKQEPAHGELMVAVDSDMSVPKDVTHIRIDVLLNNQLTYQYDFEIAPDGEFHLPGTLAIVAGAQDNPTVGVEVIGIRTLASGVKQARTFSKAVTTVPKSRIALLRVPVQWLCDQSALDLGNDSYASTCDPVDGKEAACLAGTCTEVEVAEADLPSYDPPLVFGGGEGPDAGGNCFDTLACFGVHEDVTPDDACSLLVPSGVTTPNLALAFAPGGDGICSQVDPQASCLVPLDQDDRTGWHYRDASGSGPRVIELPPAVCTKLKAGKAQGLQLSASCAIKTAGTPTCGPWSSVRFAENVDAGGFLPDASMPDASMPDAMMGDATMAPDASAEAGDSGTEGGAQPPPNPDPLTPCTDPVVVSDANLDAAIHMALALPATAPITATDAAQLTTLQAIGAGITRANGIQCFPNLTSVHLESNSLQSAAAFALCPALTTLELNTNLIVDPSPLTASTTLTYVGLGRNKITDPSSLAALTNLTFLDLDENPITDPSTLASLYASLTKLTYLDLSKASLTNADLSAIGKITALKTLYIGGNPALTDLSPLSALTNLRSIDVRSTMVTDLGPLSAIPLTSLVIAGTPITDVTGAIPFGTTLNLFYLDNIKLTDPAAALTTIGTFTNLQNLGISSLGLTSIAPLSSLYQLQVLYITSNQIQDLSPLQMLEGLEWLYASYNQISDISPLQYFGALLQVSIDGNQITTLTPLVNNPGIGMGDTVTAVNNPLNCTAEAANIAALVGRGVSVTTSCP